MGPPPGSSEGTVLHIRLVRDADGWPPFDMEEVEGVEVAPDRYRLLTPPCFTATLAVGDVVVAEEREGIRWIRRVETPGDHSVLWVITPSQTSRWEPTRVAEAHGAVVYPRLANNHFLAIDVGPDVDFDALLEDLGTGDSDGRWFLAVGSYPLGYAGS